ncbi:hypothetical protein [Exiguobacterium sp. s189]|uniref:hypothetical protein n=1 Tax=Exiguobacterium sp. s189 TaxID=2751263 RepID=UPI001BEC8ED9|nr:hypothetical protein [Exiguobacterium sp. s189]
MTQKNIYQVGQIGQTFYDLQHVLSKLYTSRMVTNIIESQRTMKLIDARIIETMVNTQRALSKLDTSRMVTSIIESQRIMKTINARILDFQKVDISSLIKTIITEDSLQNIDDQNLNKIINEYSTLDNEKSSDSESQLNDVLKNILTILNVKINNLSELFDGFKKKQAFLWVFFYLIFRIFIEPAALEITKNFVLNQFEYSTENPKQNIKDLKKEVSSEFEEHEQYLDMIRVTNRETQVYRSYFKESGRIDSIPFNRPVMILVKKRNWSLIVYMNSQGVECTGWVFTGNLLK